MRKAVVPLLASLLLCGTATGVLVATKARAQTSSHEPSLVAMAAPGTMTMAQNTAPPPAALGPGTQRPSADDIAARRQQRCEDRYAKDVGRMAYLETRLGLAGPQQPLFSAWRAVKLDIAKRHADQCAQAGDGRGEISPVDRMARMEDRLKQRIGDLDAERPAFTALYNVLTPDQRELLTPHRRGMMRARWRRPEMRMGGGMSGPGTMDQPGRPMSPPAPPQ